MGGRSDHVKCFYCDGGLKEWQEEDDPWVEHAGWFHGCGFVKLVKGEEFIQRCRATVTSNLEERKKNISTDKLSRPSTPSRPSTSSQPPAPSPAGPPLGDCSSCSGCRSCSKEIEIEN